MIRVEAVPMGAVMEAVQGVEGVVGEGELLGRLQPLNEVSLVRVLREAGAVTGAGAVSGDGGRPVA